MSSQWNQCTCQSVPSTGSCYNMGLKQTQMAITLRQQLKVVKSPFNVTLKFFWKCWLFSSCTHTVFNQAHHISNELYKHKLLAVRRFHRKPLTKHNRLVCVTKCDILMHANQEGAILIIMEWNYHMVVYIPLTLMSSI